MHTSFSQEHNAEAAAVWDAFNAGQAIRPPVALGTATPRATSAGCGMSWA